MLWQEITALFSRNSISKGYFYRIFLKIDSRKIATMSDFPPGTSLSYCNGWSLLLMCFHFFFFFLNFYAFTARVHDLITGQGAKISQAGQCRQKNISLKGVLFIPFSNLKTKVKVKDFLLKWKYMKYPRTFPIFINAYCISTMLPQHCKFIYLCQYHGLLG